MELKSNEGDESVVAVAENSSDKPAEEAKGDQKRSLPNLMDSGNCTKKEEWEIDLAKLDLKHNIAHGTYGSVYDGRDVGGLKKKTAKRKKDPIHPKAPKKAKTGFIFFSQAERENTKKENPGIAFLDLAKVLAEKRRMMSAEEKEPYEAKALADLKRYSDEIRDYKNPQPANADSGNDSDSEE